MTISGLLAIARPERLEEVRAAVDASPGAEVYFADGAGRMIVVLEAADAQESTERLFSLRDIPGMLSVELSEARNAADIEV